MQTEHLQVKRIRSNSLHKLMKLVKMNQQMKSRSPLSRENSSKRLALKNMDMVLPIIKNYNINNQQSSKNASHNDVFAVEFITLYFRYFHLSCLDNTAQEIIAKSVFAPENLPALLPVKDIKFVKVVVNVFDIIFPTVMSLKCNVCSSADQSLGISVQTRKLPVLQVWRNAA